MLPILQLVIVVKFVFGVVVARVNLNLSHMLFLSLAIEDNCEDRGEGKPKETCYVQLEHVQRNNSRISIRKC